MPAYVVALIHAISDPETYKRYVSQVEATLAPFGGRFLARKPEPVPLEGGPAPSRAVILMFPDEEAVRAWHASPAYQPVMRLRQSASKGMLLVLPGYGEPRVPVGDLHYLEIVTPDPAATARALGELHGWRFEEVDALGGARVGTLPSGARCGIRAPLRPDERPVTRAYVRVGDVGATCARFEGMGAKVALPPTEIPGHGRIAICILGGIDHGFWELA